MASSTAREQKKLVNEYRKAMKVWQALLEEESKKRSHMIDASEEKEGEPDNLREKLDEYVKDSGLLEQQKTALDRLKQAEQHLFAFFLDRATTAEEHEELSHLSRDYAGRITWLKQNFLEDSSTPISDEVEEVDLEAEINAAIGDDDDALLPPDKD